LAALPPELTARDDMRPCVGQRHEWRSDWELLNGIDYSCFHPVKSLVEKTDAECFAVALQHIARNRAAQHHRIPNGYRSTLELVQSVALSIPIAQRFIFRKRRISPAFNMSSLPADQRPAGEGRLKVGNQIGISQ